MQPAQFDLICIGSGPAGQKAAIQAAKAGFRACVIEREPQVGGSCLLSGTIPSKALREWVRLGMGPEAVGGVRKFFIPPCPRG